MSKKFNKIYNQLVKDEDDFIGMVAYAIYKKCKVEYIEKFEEEKGRTPTDEELISFHSSSCLATVVSGYEKQAIDLIRRFSDNLLANEVEEVENEYDGILFEVTQEHEAELEKREAEFAKKILELKGPTPVKQFWSGVFQSIVAAFLIFLVSIIIIVVSWGEKQGGVTGALRNMVEQISEPTAPPPQAKR